MLQSFLNSKSNVIKAGSEVFAVIPKTNHVCNHQHHEELEEVRNFSVV